MRHWSKIVVLIALVVLGAARAARAELNVVATTPDLAAVAAAVGAGRARVQALALPSQDPHWVDARPSLVLELSNADILIAVGAELELGWLPTLQVGSRNAAVQRGARGFLECSAFVELLDRPAGKVERSQGDIHPSGNPHFMLDPRVVERLAVEIGKRMAELDPGARQAYLDNTKAFVEALRAARAGWEARLAPLRQREVITFHRSLAYLASWLGLSVVGYIEPKPGIAPNPRHVADLIARGKAGQVWAVLQESWYPSSTTSLVAQQIGARFVQLPGATNFQAGESYVAFINRLVGALAAGL